MIKALMNADGATPSTLTKRAGEFGRRIVLRAKAYNQKYE